MSAGGNIWETADRFALAAFINVSSAGWGARRMAIRLWWSLHDRCIYKPIRDILKRQPGLFPSFLGCCVTLLQ